MPRAKLFFSEAFRSIGANISTTVAATMTVLIGMFLLGLFIALFSWVNSWTDHVRKDVLVKVFFQQQPEASQAQINAVNAKIQSFPETKTDEKRSIAAVMRRVADQLGNTPAVCRASYVSPAVVEQYLEGRTLEDFRPRHLRVVGARELGLDAEEQALLSLLRSWRIRQARAAA